MVVACSQPSSKLTRAPWDVAGSSTWVSSVEWFKLVDWKGSSAVRRRGRLLFVHVIFRSYWLPDWILTLAIPIITKRTTKGCHTAADNVCKTLSSVSAISIRKLVSPTLWLSKIGRAHV